jgi:hypothetical protein
MTTDDLKQSSDWEAAFECAMRGVRGVLGYTGSLAHFTRYDVVAVLASAEGENDGASWIGAFLLSDGRFAFVSAWCDYTGWGCQDGGDTQVAATLDDLVRLAMTTEDRQRLGYPPV